MSINWEKRKGRETALAEERKREGCNHYFWIPSENFAVGYEVRCKGCSVEYSRKEYGNLMVLGERLSGDKLRVEGLPVVETYEYCLTRDKEIWEDELWEEDTDAL